MRRGVAVVTVALLALAGGVAVTTAVSQTHTAPAPVAASSASVPSNGTGGTGSTAASPRMSVRVNGDPVTDGEFRVLRNETTAVLNARIRAVNGRSLETVLVRVGSEIVVDAEDPGRRLVINRTLPIGAGNNTIRVVAEDSRDGLTSRRMLLYLERVPPAMDLATPVDTVPDPYQYEDIVTNRSLVLWRGRFRDLTGFSEAMVSFRDPNSSDEYRSFGVGPDPTFAEEVHLRYGRSIVRVTSTDTLGNNYYTEFDVRVIDESDPSIDLSIDETALESPVYNASAIVRDNVWVENVSVDVHHLGRTPYQEYNRHYEPVERALYEHSRERLTVSFEQQVRLVQGRNLVSITGRDHRGREEARTFEVGYYPESERPPTVDILNNGTRITGEESVYVSAVVTDGNSDIRRVLVEVENLDRKQLTDVESFRLDNESTFLFEDTVNITAGVTEIKITAIDGQGNLTTDLLYLDTRTGRQTEQPPPGYEDVANDSEIDITDPSDPAEPTPVEPGPVSPTPAGTTVSTGESPETGTAGGDASTGGGNDGSDRGATDAADTGGSLIELTSLPVLALLAILLIGGGYYGWIKLTRV